MTPDIRIAPSINDFHNSNYQVVLSNMPGLPKESDMAMYHNFVKDVTLPGFSLETMVTKHMGEDYLHNMGSRKNNELGDLSITFKANEGLLNYYYLVRWMTAIRYQKNDNFDADTRMKENVIKNIFVNVLTNQKSNSGRISYEKCVPTSVSGLSLSYTDKSIVTFQASFKFQEMGFALAENLQL